jgi:predicted TIM-barrel fold metal-dependent hydrolase
MSAHVSAPTRRTFLKGAAAAGLALSPLLAARSVAAAEPAAAASMNVIDAHVHLWDLSTFPVPWIKGNAVLDQSYVLDDYQAHTAGLGITGIVYVEVAIASEYTLLEADWVVARAAENPLIQGMVAYAPLEYGEQVRSYLDALVTRGPLIKGVRRGLPDPKDTKFDKAGYLRGIQILSEYGLSFDILGKGTAHLDHAIEIAKGAPDTSLMIDHLLKPDIKQHTLDPWRAQMTQLASFPNVSTKISGLVTEADPQNWKPEDLQPYVEHALNAFGEDRVVYGGDWPPVLTANTPYARWFDTLDTLTSGLSPQAKRKLFGDNARRFYRLSAA